MTRSHHAELFAPTRCAVGEAPSWDSNLGCLVIVDITQKRVHLIGEHGEQLERFETPTHVGAALPRQGGGWLLALRDGFATLDPNGAVQHILGVNDAQSGIRFNEAKCDPKGYALAGTMAYSESPGQGSLYRLDSGPVAELLLDQTTISNGLGWSADGSRMYFIDSPTRTIAAFDYDHSTGHISGRRRLVEIPKQFGMPDGLCVDDDDCVWVALFGGGAIHRYTPDGVLDAVVTLPVSQPTSCALGGADKSQLFITSATHLLSDEDLAQQPLAGAVFVVDCGTSGPPPTLWDPHTIDRTKR